MTRTQTDIKDMSKQIVTSHFTLTIESKEEFMLKPAPGVFSLEIVQKSFPLVKEYWQKKVSEGLPLSDMEKYMDGYCNGLDSLLDICDAMILATKIARERERSQNNDSTEKE